MAWSSYAHLPNSEDEYWKILSSLENGMPVAEADKVIANVKGKEKVTHHYRSNLANIGLYDVRDGKIFLNYDVKKLTDRKSYLKELLLQCILNHESTEIHAVKSIAVRERSCHLGKIVDCLKEKYPELEKSSLARWLRPVANLLEIAGVLDMDGTADRNKWEILLQDAYLDLSKTFGKVVPLEDISRKIKKTDHSYDIEKCLEILLDDENVKFKTELIMMPSWAAQNKVYKIDGEYYTHLRIKGSFV